MMVLHAQQLIFLKPRKVAGTSFEIALSKFAGADDIITPITPKDEELRLSLGFRGAQNYEKRARDILLRPTLRDLKSLKRGKKLEWFYNHIPAADTKSRLGTDVWDRYTKLSIVRNPFDRAVSQYFWDMRRIQPERRPGFVEWCLKNPRALGQNNEQYIIDGKTIIDVFIRYEHFEQDIRALERMKPGLAGLHEMFASIKAKDSTRPKQGASVQEMFAGGKLVEELIHRHSRYEIERFGYSLNAA